MSLSWELIALGDFTTGIEVKADNSSVIVTQDGSDRKIKVNAVENSGIVTDTSGLRFKIKEVSVLPTIDDTAYTTNQLIILNTSGKKSLHISIEEN